MKIPELTKEYIEKARGLIREDQYGFWDEVVPIRLGDLYHGMELDQTLEICKIMRKKYLPHSWKVRKAYRLFMKSGHSGMSAQLTARMIETFCPDGKEVADAVMNFKYK